MPAVELAARLVRETFGARDGALAIGGVPVRALAAAHGTPLFAYDAGVIRQRYRRLAAALAGFAQVYYSIKANPNPAVARLMVREGAGLEVASGAEFLLARTAGAAPSDILFAGPGKGEAELKLAIAAGIGEIHLEGFDEIDRVAAIGEALGRRVPVAVRVNPSEAAQGGAMRMGGRPAAFGFDEECLPDVVAAIACRPALALCGLHLFAGTQILDAAVLLAQWRHGLELAARLTEIAGQRLVRIDLGGGLGIPYHGGDGELDLEALAKGAAALAGLQRADPRIAGATILIEPGRYLVGPAGLYLAAVNAVKLSRGQRFVILDGGLHHHLAASGNLGQVVKRDYPLVAAEALDAPASPATLVGPLCTPLDTLGRQTPLPESLAPGDLVAILQSGAYGLSSSPVGFLGHPMPAEVLVDGGQVEVIRPRGTFAAPLVNLVPAPPAG